MREIKTVEEMKLFMRSEQAKRSVVLMKEALDSKFLTEFEATYLCPRLRSVESELDEEQELHTETHQCEEREKVSKILNLSKTPTFEKFTEFDSEVQVCGLWTDDEIFS
ncbi:hypothetical protein AVEN_96269-1 [Araneus ventricosus]|uniref:Uncharacterized protein n=1 Tax=Araneus ventricosus TaxID=182803 RepID=A0A4Y2H2F3_ARAVE|nr:hypothetical protein AVEN_96269-1 [Araneus ventricosus]